MGRAVLIVQNVSFAHIQNVALFVRDMLRKHFDPRTDLILCEQINEADYEDGSVVFVIGEGFARHKRCRGCFYVYLNFSVVEALGNPLKMSREGWSAIRRKKQMLARKIDFYDLILDYLPTQSTVLARRLRRSVHSFPVALPMVSETSNLPLESRPYDVCFVGAVTPRRAAVLDALRAQGWRLSPHRDVVFEEVAMHSKCCLNIHAHRSNHLETPRIVGALSAGCPLFTEHSLGLDRLLPAGMCVAAKHSNLATKVDAMLRAPQELEALRHRAGYWYQSVYWPDCQLEWAELAAQIKSSYHDARPQPETTA